MTDKNIWLPGKTLNVGYGTAKALEITYISGQFQLQAVTGRKTGFCDGKNG